MPCSGKEKVWSYICGIGDSLRISGGFRFPKRIVLTYASGSDIHKGVKADGCMKFWKKLCSACGYESRTVGIIEDQTSDYVFCVNRDVAPDKQNHVTSHAASAPRVLGRQLNKAQRDHSCKCCQTYGLRGYRVCKSKYAKRYDTW